MQSLKSHLTLVFSSLIIVIIMGQAAFDFVTTKKALNLATNESLSLSVNQMKIHFERDLDQYKFALTNIAKEEYINRFVVDNSEFNREFLDSSLSTKDLLDTRPSFGVLDFQGELTYNTKNVDNAVLLKSLEKYTKLEKLHDRFITIDKSLNNQYFVSFFVPVIYKTSIEGAVFAQLPLDLLFKRFTQSLSDDFALQLTLDDVVIGGKGLSGIKSIPLEIKMVQGLKMNISISRDYIQRSTQSLFYQSIFAIVIAILFIIIIIRSWIIPRSVKPLSEFQHSLKSVVKTDMSQVEDDFKMREINSLRDTFNNLLKELKQNKEESILKSHKAGMAENAVSVLHNIGNIVTSMIMRISNSSEQHELKKVSKLLSDYNKFIETNLENKTLEDSLNNSEKGKMIKEWLPQLCDEIDRIDNESKEDNSFYLKQFNHIGDIISNQQTLASGNFQNRSVIEVVEMVEDCLKLKEDQLNKNNISIQRSFSELSIRVNKHGFSQVLLNFIVNSIESILERKKKDVSVSGIIKIEVIEKNNLVAIRVVDNGIGIKQEDLQNLFSFGYSTKNRSSGFGLHNCANYIKEHQGLSNIDSGGEYQGASVEMLFPKA
jgi:signal transduction histidine kinase